MRIGRGRHCHPTRLRAGRDMLNCNQPGRLALLRNKAAGASRRLRTTRDRPPLKALNPFFSGAGPAIHETKRLMSRTCSRSSPATDSPLFWLIVFVSMALVMSVAVEPKFARRQERLDRMHESRQQSRPMADGATDNGVSVEKPPRPVQSWQPGRRITLRPLTSVLAVLLLISLVAWHVIRRRPPLVGEPPLPIEDRGTP